MRNKKMLSIITAITLIVSQIGAAAQATTAQTPVITVKENFSTGVLSAENLSYSEADGSAAEPVIEAVDGFENIKALTWKDGSNTGIKGTTGEVNERLNISSTHNEALITSFSFKVLSVNPTSASGYAAPVYILLGENESGKQSAFITGGYVKRSDGNFYPAYDFNAKIDPNMYVKRVNNQNKTPFNSNTYFDLQSVNEDVGKVFLTVTVTINDGNTATLTVSKPETDSVTGWSFSVTKDISGITNPYYAVSSGLAYENNENFISRITDVSVNYKRTPKPIVIVEPDERTDFQLIEKFNNSGFSVANLTYTKNNGTDLLTPLIGKIPGIENTNALYWNSRDKGLDGDCHSRLNIPTEYRYSALTSFSFKTTAPDPTAINSKAAPVYVILGGTDDSKQLAVTLGGYLKIQKTSGGEITEEYYVPSFTKNNSLLNAPTGTSAATSNQVSSGTPHYSLSELQSENGKVLINISVVIGENEIEITVSKPETVYAPAYSYNISIDTFDIKNTYYAISTGYAYQDLRTAYVTDVNMNYEGIPSPIDEVNSLIGGLPIKDTVNTSDYENACALMLKLQTIEEKYAHLSSDEKTMIPGYLEISEYKVYIQSIIDTYNTKILQGATMNFENESIDTIDAVNCKNSTPARTTWGIANNTFKDTVNPSNKVVKISPNSPDDKYTNSLGMYLLDSGLVDGKTNALNTFSTKVLISTSKPYPLVVFEYIDDNNWSGVYFAFSNGNLSMRRVDASSSNIQQDKTAIAQYWQSYPLSSVVGRDYSYDFSEMWVDVTVRYSVTSVAFTINTGFGLIHPYSYKLNLVDSAITRVGLASYGQNNGYSYFDDVSFTFQKTNEVTEANHFLASYEELLNTRAVTLSDTDAEKLRNASIKYDSMSNEEKYALPLIKEQLSELEAAMIDVLNTGVSQSDKNVTDDYWDTHDTYTVTETFDNESSLERFVDKDMNQFDRPNYGKNPVVEYNNEMQSSCVSMFRTALTLKNDFMPENPKLDNVSFDAMAVDTGEGGTETGNLKSTNALRSYLWYYDSSNYAWIDMYTADGRYNYRGEAKLKYIVMAGGANVSGGVISCDFDLYSPIHYSFLYVNRKIIVNISQDYVTTVEGEEVVETAEFNQTFTAPYDSSVFAITGDNVTCLDNLSITYTKGDYDIDRKVADISVLYSGNTFLEPGDTVSLSGENLGMNVSAVRVAHINNETEISNRGFISQIRFDSNGVKSGTYSRNPVSVWDTDWNAVEQIKILQTTVDSVKFMLPNNLPSGIYAVRLYGNEFTSNADDKTVYINQPYIDYAVGDEGENITPGGSLQIVGKNIAPLYDEGKNDNVKVVMVGSGYEREVNIKTIKSDYSLVIDVPTDVKIGETYEVWIYSGFGDNTCWSVPLKVNVIGDIRSTWGDTFYNIQKDFGATGEPAQNCTGIMIRALQALSEAGGGTLYMPRGIYRLEQPVIIPENVILTGETLEDSVILYSPFQWNFGKMPNYVLEITQNVEISNLSFYGTRVSGYLNINNLVKSGSNDEGKSNNIYLSNLSCRWSPYSGAPYGVYNNISPLITSTEMVALVATEKVNYFVNKTVDYAPSENVQLNDIEFTTYGRGFGIYLSFDFISNCRYWQLRNVAEKTGWSMPHMDYSIAENYSHQNSSSGLWGNGVYADNVYVGHNMENNRELICADHTAQFTDVQLIPVGNGGQTRTFLLQTNRALYYLTNAQVYVSSGNGAGQTRIITDAKNISNQQATAYGINNGLMYVEITINYAFALPVNRNSLFLIGFARENVTYVNCHLEDGGAGFGFYGHCADIVMDNNALDEVGNQYIQARVREKCWYITYKDNTHSYGSYFLRGNGTETGSEFSKVTFYSANINGLRGITIRNNDFGSYYVYIKSNDNASTDFIIENNVFTKGKYAMYLDGSSGCIDGAYIGQNTFDEVGMPYAGAWQLAEKALNLSGSRRVVIEAKTEISGIPGDANLDGSLSVKDVSIIRYYIIGKVTLTDLQFSQADIDGDGNVTLMDAILIRQKILQAFT